MPSCAFEYAGVACQLKPCTQACLTASVELQNFVRFDRAAGQIWNKNLVFDRIIWDFLKLNLRFDMPQKLQAIS